MCHGARGHVVEGPHRRHVQHTPPLSPTASCSQDELRVYGGLMALRFLARKYEFRDEVRGGLDPSDWLHLTRDGQPRTAKQARPWQAGSAKAYRLSCWLEHRLLSEHSVLCAAPGACPHPD